MDSISSLINGRVELNEKNERRQILRDIVSIYEKDKPNRRKENWKRYCKWCKMNKKENSPDNQKLFKKTKEFINESPVRNIAVKLAHIPTKDLYYMKSVAQDKFNRKESVGGFIFGALKAK